LPIDSTNCFGEFSYSLNVYEDKTLRFEFAFDDALGASSSEEFSVDLDVDAEAPVVERIFLFDENGDEVEAVSGNEMEVYLGFEFSDENNVTRIVLDIEELSEPLSPMIPTEISFNRVQLDSMCDHNETSICYYNVPITYNTGNLNPTIFYEIEDDWSNALEDGYAMNFDLDNRAPEIIDIYSDNCDEEKCYISTGINNIHIKTDDSSEDFDLRYVFFKLEGSSIVNRVDNCSSGECLGLLGTPCAHGKRYKFMITNNGGMPSMDDAGNELTGMLDREFWCDNEVDQDANSADFMNQVKVFSNNEYSDLFEDAVVGNSDLRISAIVKEKNGIALARLNTSLLKDGNIVELTRCNQIYYEGDVAYNCTFPVTQINNDRYDATVKFEFFDVAGNVFEADYNVHVIRSLLNYSVPQCFSFSDSEVRPGVVDRIALYLAGTTEIEYPLKIWSKFKKTNSCSNAIIYDVLPIDMETCVFETDTGVNYSEVSPFRYEIETSGEVADDYVVRLAAMDEGHDINDVTDMSVTCNISLLIATDTDKYEMPLEVPFSFDLKFRNSRLGEPGGKFADTINDKSKLVQKTHKFIGLIDDIVATLTQVCEIQGALSAFEGYGVGLEIAGDITGKIAPSAMQGLGQGMVNMGNGIATTSDKISDKTYGELFSEIDSIVRTACSKLSCSGSENLGEALSSQTAKDEFFASYTEGDSMFSGFAGNMGQTIWKDLNSTSVDPYKSLVAAFRANKGGVCIPAVFYHIRNWEQMECSVLNCMRENARRGYDIKDCYDMRYTFFCKQMIGEIVEGTAAYASDSFGWINKGMDMADNLYSVVRNGIPKFFTTAWGTFCKNKGVDGNLYEDTIAVVNQKEFNEKVKDLEGDGDFKKQKKALEKQYDGKVQPFMIYFCHVPQAINRFLDYTMNTKDSGFSYQPLEVDMCDIALCTEEDRSKCESGSGFFPQLNGWSQYDIFGLTGRYRVNSEIMNLGEYMKDEFRSIRDEQLALEKIKDKESNNYKNRFKRHEKKINDFKEALKSYAPTIDMSKIELDSTKKRAYGLLGDYIDCKARGYGSGCSEIVKSFDKAQTQTETTDNYKGVPLVHKDTYSRNLEYLEKMEPFDNIFRELDFAVNYDQDYISDRLNEENTEHMESFYDGKGGCLNDLDCLKVEAKNLGIDLKKYSKDNTVTGSKGLRKAIEVEEMRLTAELEFGLEDVQGDTVEEIIENVEKEKGMTVAEVGTKFSSEIAKLQTTIGSVNDEFTIKSIGQQLGVPSCRDGSPDPCTAEEIKERLSKFAVCFRNNICDKEGGVTVKNIKDSLKKVNDEIGDYVKKKEREQKVYETYHKMERRFELINKLTTMLFQQEFMKDLMETISTFGAGYDNPIFTFLEDLRYDSIVNSVCNLNSPAADAVANAVGYSGGDSSNAYDCSGDYCETVLTISPEYMIYNYSEALDPSDKTADAYLYTLAYYVGPIDDSIQYYVKFIDDDGEKHYVSDDDGDKILFTLNPGKIDSLEKAWVSSNMYKKICFDFNSEFPPNQGSPSSDDEWCRNFELKAFNTGEPVDEEMLENSGSGASGSSGSVWP
jgi:hypothetical protein